MTRILIADDHEMIRRGLRRTLEEQSGWMVCGEAADGRAALVQTGALRASLAVDAKLADRT